jgi:hypothetical protein
VVVLSLIVVGLVLVLMVLFYTPGPISKPQSPAPPTSLVTPPEDPRYAIARDFVRAELLAPDAAQFPTKADAYHVTSLGQDRYQVSSYATVKTFGAGMKMNWFTVTMRYIGNGRYVLDGKGVETFEDGPKGLRQE